MEFFFCFFLSSKFRFLPHYPPLANALSKNAVMRNANVMVHDFSAGGPIRVFNLHKSDKNRINWWQKRIRNEWGNSVGFFSSSLVGFNLVKTGNTVGILKCCCTAPHHKQKQQLMISFDAITTYGSTAYTFAFHCQSDRTHPSIRLFACSLARSLVGLLVSVLVMWLKIYIDRLLAMSVYLSCTL